MLVEEVDGNHTEEQDLCRLHTAIEEVEGEAKKINEEYECI